MTSIDAASQLAALVRQQIRASRDAAGLRGKAAPRDHAGGEQDAPRAASADDLPALVIRRVAAIDPQDPQRRRKAFRIFLETVLLAELGGDLINDPAFYDLVAKVQAQMEAHPQLAEAIARASDALMAAAPPK